MGKTMRKITQEVKYAWDAEREFKQGNTQVGILEDRVLLFLHGNCIAQKKRGTEFPIWFSMCGWTTPTTRDRLNALGIGIYQHQGTQFIRAKVDGKEGVSIEPHVLYKYKGGFEVVTVRKG